MSDLYDLYVIGRGHGHPVKVGRSTNVLRRLTALQTGSPWSLYLLGHHAGEGSTEKAMHAKLPFRMEGEWFAWSPDVEVLCNRMGAPEVELVEVGFRVGHWCEDAFRFDLLPAGWLVCMLRYEKTVWLKMPWSPPNVVHAWRMVAGMDPLETVLEQDALAAAIGIPLNGSGGHP